MTTVLTTPLPAAAPDPAPPLRLSVTPPGERCRLDGAWWPHSRDLDAELPPLIAELDHRWGRITHATVNRLLWPSIPHQLRTGRHTLRLGWFDAEQDPYEISLSSYKINRWDLLVVPPETDPETARGLMAAASRPGNRHSGSALIDPATTTLWGSARRPAPARRS